MRYEQPETPKEKRRRMKRERRKRSQRRWVEEYERREARVHGEGYRLPGKAL